MTYTFNPMQRKDYRQARHASKLPASPYDYLASLAVPPLIFTHGQNDTAEERIFSYARAAAKTSRSAKAFPTICKPTGKPEEVKPQGIESAGCPVTLNG